MLENRNVKTRSSLHMSLSTRRKITYFLLGTLLCGFSRLTSDALPLKSISTVLYGGLFAAWALTVQRRILNEYTRRVMSGLVWYMLFLFVCRGCRYTILRGDLLIERLMWYAYYVSFLSMPLLCFFAADSLDEEHHTHHRMQTVLIAIDTILCIAFLTNDLHHLAFGDLGMGDMVNYHSYGPVYYIAVVWIVILLAATVIRIISRIRMWRNLPYPWLPLGMLLLFGVWFFFNHQNGGRFNDRFWPHLFNLPEMFCLMIIFFWESCIQNGMVPSNTDYEDIIRLSGISAVFSNDDNSRYLVSENASVPPDMDPEKVEADPVHIDKDTILHAKKVEGGAILWTEDLSAVNRFNEALADTGEQLSEENALLQAENEWKERHYTLETQNRLYDGIHELVLPQLKRIRSEISSLKNDPECPDLKPRLAVLSFLGAYVKRRSNLTLISEEHDHTEIPLQELVLSIRESLEYLKLCGVITGMNEDVSGISMPASQVLLAYDFFQAVTEAAMPLLSAEQIRLSTGADSWRLRISLADPEALLTEDWKKEELMKAGGSVRIYREDETGYAELSFTGKEALV